MRERAHIALGSNLGDRVAALHRAIGAIAATPGIEVTAVSSLCETAPVGKLDQPRFVNAVMAVETSLAPQELMSRLLAIEASMGRVRAERWGPRIIDLDLLTHGETVCQTPTLMLPHPRMRERHFVLVPLLEVSPDLHDPLTGEAYRDILSGLPQTAWGRRLHADHG